MGLGKKLNITDYWQNILADDNTIQRLEKKPLTVDQIYFYGTMKESVPLFADTYTNPDGQESQCYSCSQI